MWSRFVLATAATSWFPKARLWSRRQTILQTLPNAKPASRQSSPSACKQRARAAALADVILRIALQAGEDGRLFGSVGHHDVARMLEDMGHGVSHGDVRMQDGPIKRTGEYPVRLHLHPEVELDIQVIVERA